MALKNFFFSFFWARLKKPNIAFWNSFLKSFPFHYRFVRSVAFHPVNHSLAHLFIYCVQLLFCTVEWKFWHSIWDFLTAPRIEFRRFTSTWSHVRGAFNIIQTFPTFACCDSMFLFALPQKNVLFPISFYLSLASSFF